MAPDAARLWVVDDDRTVRFVLAQALRDAGYVVQAFDSARAALAALEDEAAPALVFTDVRMPGMDGLSFLEALKAQRPDLPVVVMSAYTDVASTAGAFRGGAHEFLSKPFDLDEAVALAARALPQPVAAASCARRWRRPPCGGSVARTCRARTGANRAGPRWPRRGCAAGGPRRGRRRTGSAGRGLSRAP